MAEPIGIVFVLFGLPGAIWPYKVTRFGEQFDAIGSKRSWSAVEPADWNVALTRVVSVGMVIVGLLLTLFG